MFDRKLQISPEYRDKVNIRSKRLVDVVRRFQLSVLLNESRIFEVENISDSGVCVSGDLTDIYVGSPVTIEVRSYERLIFLSKGRVIWATKDPIESAGIHFLSDGANLNFFSFLTESARILGKVKTEANEILNVPEKFKVVISDLLVFSRMMRDELDAFEARTITESPEREYSIKESLKIGVFAEAKDNFLRISESLNSVYISENDPAKIIAMQKYFRYFLGSILNVGSFPVRALQKPRGYAGDFEMMAQIYRGQPEGKTLFASLIHFWSVHEPSADSVRFRRKYFKESFTQLLSRDSGHFYIASIACGPSKEVQDFIEERSADEISRTTFVLIDQDLEALQESKKSIDRLCLRKNVIPEVYFVPLSVKEILKGELSRYFSSETNFDLIYTAGLYDYLEHSVAKNLTSLLWELLASNGRLLIGNFSKKLPSRAMLELATDWHLIYRDPDEMISLSPSNVKASVVDSDPAGIQLILNLEK